MSQEQIFPQVSDMRPHDLGITKLREKKFYRPNKLISLLFAQITSLFVYYEKSTGCINILRREFSYARFSQPVGAQNKAASILASPAVYHDRVPLAFAIGCRNALLISAAVWALAWWLT